MANAPPDSGRAWVFFTNVSRGSSHSSAASTDARGGRTVGRSRACVAHSAMKSPRAQSAACRYGSRRPYSPRWCENYAYTVSAKVPGHRAGNSASATPRAMVDGFCDGVLLSARCRARSVADGMPVRVGMLVCVGRREPARAWLPHADTGRVDGVTALRCNRQRHRHLPRPGG
jgi:hypothetical protein